MQSANNTIISRAGQTITDSAGNVWEITNGQVSVNGTIDPTTANVIEMAYENGLVWQKNAHDLWWSKSSPSGQWSPTYGTRTDPIPNQHPSANDASLIAKATGVIVDAQGNQWTIANGQVMVNGVLDQTTARVVALVYSKGQVWQQNADGLWWAKASPSGGWNPPYGTPDAPRPDPKAPVTSVLLSSSDTPLMDASGNEWAIANGQVTLNGVADPTTRNVTELAYVNGQIWQRNADGLWWSKTLPSDGWNPPYGTSTSPIAELTRTWAGGNGAFSAADHWTPAGVPQTGDTAVINSGTVLVDQGYGTGVNFDLTGSAADMRFNATGTYTVGRLEGTGTIDTAYFQSKPVTVSAAGVSLAAGQALSVTEFQQFGHVVLRGDSTLGIGSSLTIQAVGVNHTPYAALENDGTISAHDATVRVGTLTGNGTVKLTGNSTMQVMIKSSDTIELQSGHLEIGIQSAPSVAMLFQAPITDFGSGSTITLDSTTATAEVFKHLGANAGELMLYSGSTLVADLHISGQNQLYASDTSGGAFGGSVTISAHDNGHSLPIVSHVS